MKDSTKYQNYMLEVGKLLREKTIQARNQCNESKPNEKAYYDGYYFGLQRLIAIMLIQADIYDIPLEALDLENIDPYNF